MTNQTSSLRKLENIFNGAINSGNKEEASGSILLRVMEIEEVPHHLTIFYDVLIKAKNEAQSIRNKPNLDRYLKIIEDLHQTFIVNHLWVTPWKVFSTHIERANILTTLDALADMFERQNPSVVLKRDFLEKIDDDFTDLLKQVIESDLSQGLKNFLIDQLEKILTAIRQHDIDSRNDLENTSKSFMSDLLLIEPSLSKEDKDNPVYRKIIGKTIGIVLRVTPYLISIYPDIHTFWIPRIDELIAQCEQFAQDDSNIQIIISKTLSHFSQETPKVLEGKDEKIIGPSKE